MTPRRHEPRQGALASHPLACVTHHDLLSALVHGWCLGAVVPMTLDLVEEDPLISAGQFPGDLMRGLMEVAGSYWGRHPRHYARYRAALRASAAKRRELPVEARMTFWEPLAIPPPPVRG